MSKKAKVEKEEAKKVIMWEFQVDVSDATFEKVVAQGLEWIKDDKEALFNYAANRILAEQYVKGKKASKKK